VGAVARLQPKYTTQIDRPWVKKYGEFRMPKVGIFAKNQLQQTPDIGIKDIFAVEIGTAFGLIQPTAPLSLSDNRQNRQRYTAVF
jgi:hypothetical protein